MKNKIYILRVILIFLLLGVFYIIFGFSGQNGEQSGKLSREITEIITKNIKSIQELEKNEKEIVLSKIEHIIRKLAHFSLYTVVGILLMSLMYTYKLETKRKVVLSGGIGAIYAISDEIHQFFSPGRAPLLGDVFIDFSGVIFGIVLVVVGMKLISKVTIKVTR